MMIPLIRAAAPTPEAADLLLNWIAETPPDCNLPEWGDRPSQKIDLLIPAPATPKSFPTPSSETPASEIPNAQIRQLILAVDESGYGLAAWIQALLTARRWLTDHRLTATFPDALEYLRCCAATTGGKAPLTDLPGTVLEMLDKYGMDAARPLS